MSVMTDEFKHVANQLIDAGRILHTLGMTPATSGNFSCRMADGSIAITVSGTHKGQLTIDDIMCIRDDGNSIDNRSPSAETKLHLQLYNRYPEINAVLHPHSKAATITAKIAGKNIVLEGYELLKAFEGINTHELRFNIPIFENDQNISRLATCIDNYMDDNDRIHAYVIRGHGFYCWASTVKAAINHCEALDFLLQCELISPHNDITESS